MEQPVYLTRVKGRQLLVLDREAQAKTVEIEPTEYQFKLALTEQRYDQVLHMIRNSSSLVGQAVIAYLQKKGYSEVLLLTSCCISLLLPLLLIGGATFCKGSYYQVRIGDRMWKP